MSNNPLSLIVTLTQPLQTTAETIKNHLQDFHPMFNHLTVSNDISSEDCLIFFAHFDSQEIRFVGINEPLPPSFLDSSVAWGKYDNAYKEEIYQHKAHLILYQVDSQLSPIEQYATLAMIGAALKSIGASSVINESALTSLPTALLIPLQDDNIDQLEYLLTMPLLLLYCGIATVQFEDTSIWARTYSAEKLHLINFALPITEKTQHIDTFKLFSSLLDYSLNNSNKYFHPGDTTEYDGQNFILREPFTHEHFLIDPDGYTLVLEPVYTSY